MRHLVVLGLLGCARPTAPAPVVANHDATRASCAIHGLYAEGPELVVHASADADDPIFRVTDANGVSATWTELPADASRARAHVEIEIDGLDANGWASIAGRELHLARREVVVPGHVWVTAGSHATVLGSAGGDAVVVAIPTLFETPNPLRATVACADLVDPDTELAATNVVSHAPHALSMCGNLDLYDAPGGAPVFTATSDVTWDFDRRETIGGFEHIVGALDGEPSRIEFDGWAPVPGNGDPVCRGVAKTFRVRHASILARDPSIRTLARDTAVFAGPGELQIGILHAGSEIGIRDFRAGFVRIAQARSAVEPGPRGFYVRVDALSADQSGSAPPHHAW